MKTANLKPSPNDYLGITLEDGVYTARITEGTDLQSIVFAYWDARKFEQPLKKGELIAVITSAAENSYGVFAPVDCVIKRYGEVDETGLLIEADPDNPLFILTKEK